jgi:hypothetical protein
MKAFVFSLLLGLLCNVAVAYEDLMVVCYALIPDGADANNICGSNRRVLHALQGPDQGRHLQGGMQCGSYCAGWNEQNFCTEYMCDEDTRGYTCDSLKESAKIHFKEVAAKSGQPECTAMMEKLSCLCIDQAVVMQQKPDID